MFKIESYVTPILLSYVDKYVKDFKPADAQVSLWGGGVALHNLVLKPDVLQQEVALPFTLISGRIHELLIQVPWTKIMSEPIVVTIDTIECILSLRPPIPADDAPSPEPSRKNPVVEAPPGYMQALVRRVVSNISLRIHHLIVKYVQDDIVMSLNVKHLSVVSAGVDWNPAFADIEQTNPVVRRLVCLDDLTLCLDRADADGKIRFYQEPVLYRCQLELRVLTRLQSANTRRAISLSVQIQSNTLAWGLTSEQLALLLRLCRTSAPPPPHAATTAHAATTSHAATTAHAKPVAPQPVQAPPMHTSSVTEPSRENSWSDWAWSWLPTWTDRVDGVEETAPSTAPIPVQITARFDKLAILLKVIEQESSGRRRARSVLELVALHTVGRCFVAAPCSTIVQLALRKLTLHASGACVCGHTDQTTEGPSCYLTSLEEKSEEWSWPEEVDIAVADENITAHFQTKSGIEGSDDIDERGETLWRAMSPTLLVSYQHDRTPPHDDKYTHTSPTDEYSDWVEYNALKVKVEPVEIRVTSGLIHRVAAILQVLRDMADLTPPEVRPPRTLTTEECETLYDNVPERRACVDMPRVRVLVCPWSHANTNVSSALHLLLDCTGASVVITSPMYPDRVCAAASQLAGTAGSRFQRLGRRRASLRLTSASLAVCGAADSRSSSTAPRGHCAVLAGVSVLSQALLRPELFPKHVVKHSYNAAILEVNISGSAARLQAAMEIIKSNVNRTMSHALEYSSLTNDVLNDEEAVAVDVTVEEVSCRGYMSDDVHMHMCSVLCVRATLLHAPSGETAKQAWLLAAPAVPSTTPFAKLGLQYCITKVSNSFDYLGIWLEPAAVCVDPLLVAYTNYRPTLVHARVSQLPPMLSKTVSASQFFRRKVTPPAPSGAVRSRTASVSELVHIARSRSQLSSEQGGSKPNITQRQKSWYSGERLVSIHSRLRRLLLCVESGHMVVYVTTATASALDTVTLTEAVEAHAANHHKVLAVDMGRLVIHSSPHFRHMWKDVRPDGPTYVSSRTNIDPINRKAEESFPWKLELKDMTCYTLEGQTMPADQERARTGLRSHLKPTLKVNTNTLLDAVTTTVNASVVFKTQHRSSSPNNTPRPRRNFFTSRPFSLMEFLKDPRRRDRSSEARAEEDRESQHGAVVPLGVHVHADTPFVIVRIGIDEVALVSSAVHMLSHVVSALQRAPFTCPEPYTGDSQRSFRTRSASEYERLSATMVSTSEDNAPTTVTSTFGFQWVVSSTSVTVTSANVRFALDIDDVILTVDLQNYFNQLKLKLATFSLRRYQMSESGEWQAGALGGRVIEAKEPDSTTEDNHFLSVTVTLAQISTLPQSWKDELHPKLLEYTHSNTTWEIYTSLAQLEAVIEPTLVSQVMDIIHRMRIEPNCDLHDEKPIKSNGSWPFCYVKAGGLRLIVTCQTPQADTDTDDALLLLIGKGMLNPHPDNPTCRRLVSSEFESGTPVLEGRQFELHVQRASLRSGRYHQLLHHQEEEVAHGVGNENPAVKWTNPQQASVITPIIHSLDIGVILSPPLYTAGALTCGAALEVNVLTDCRVELSVQQLQLHHTILHALLHADHSRIDSASNVGVGGNECPLAELLSSQTIPTMDSSPSLEEDVSKASISGNAGVDSGLDSKSNSTHNATRAMKSASINTAKETAKAQEYLEVFVAMGTVELSLYTRDTGDAELAPLRIDCSRRKRESNYFDPDMIPVGVTEVERNVVIQAMTQTPRTNLVGVGNSDEDGEDKPMSDGTGSGSLVVRHGARAGNRHEKMPQCERTLDGKLPLLHVTLQQPNLYFWRKKQQQHIQFSLFDLWLGLGAGEALADRHLTLFSTAKGIPDPVTDIPPALLTCNMALPQGPSSASNRGSVKVDIERPILVEVCTQRIDGLKAIHRLVDVEIQKFKELFSHDHDAPSSSVKPDDPLLYELKTLFFKNSIETVTISTNQLGLSGSLGSLSVEQLTIQASALTRPERLTVQMLVTALFVTAGAPSHSKHIVLAPMMLGVQCESVWEAWLRTEGREFARRACVRVRVDADRVVLDARPRDVHAARLLCDAVQPLIKAQAASAPSKPSNTTSRKPSKVSIDSTRKTGDQHYKDDLRSGAFKMVTGGQLPMAYQVVVNDVAVTWRYPHPRAITRIVAFPLPNVDEEVDCVLEVYSPLVDRWESHTHFKLPVNEPNELKLNVKPPESVFAVMWRFRACSKTDDEPVPFEFNMKTFLPKQDALIPESPSEPDCNPLVPAWQLWGVVRVDSCMSPHVIPTTALAVSAQAVDVNLHNDLRTDHRPSPLLVGYYVSKPSLRNHCVLRASLRNTMLRAQLGSSAGRLYVLDTTLAGDILDSATGTLEQLVQSVRISGSLSNSASPVKHTNTRARVRAGVVRVALHAHRMQTVRAVVEQWTKAIQMDKPSQPLTNAPLEFEATAAELEGHISLWIHNRCATRINIGQEGTDQHHWLEPGASLAYRWYDSSAPQWIRFAEFNSNWSQSVPFVPGSHSVRLPDEAGSERRDVHAHVVRVGARWEMNLHGRLQLANICRQKLLFKVKQRLTADSWCTLVSGELAPESSAASVLCQHTDMMLKIKFDRADCGWSGDIPLKECTKENVPWLVKIPHTGPTEYTCVWCRVSRGRHDNRLLAAVWPLYVLRSHLALEAEVVVLTEGSASAEADHETLVSVPAAGATTQLTAPGTTANRHKLSFRYKSFGCSITREPVPLHYSTTETSVFNKQSPCNYIHEVTKEIDKWLEESSSGAETGWPYSLVTKHRSGPWHPPLLQPRADVVVRYKAVNAGGGCSLEVALCPLVLVCNATAVTLTLLADDLSPLCRLSPSDAIAAPSVLVQRPFFVSVDVEREMFVSGSLLVSGSRLGQYAAPKPGELALDSHAHIAIHCHNTVSLLTLHYEAYHDINVLGATTTYTLINQLHIDIMVSAVAVPVLVKDCTLQCKESELVPPTKDGSSLGVPLSRFTVQGRWRGLDPDELNKYVCIRADGRRGGHGRAVPVRLGVEPYRRPIALVDENDQSMAAVVTQQWSDGRWLVVVAMDPCPQLLVRNHTDTPLAIAQPVVTTIDHDDPTIIDQPITVLPDCEGTDWRFIVEAHQALHYSLPSHRPTPPVHTQLHSNALLCVAVVDKALEEHWQPTWSGCVSLSGGEQLLQLTRGAAAGGAGNTLKLRLHPHHHTTLLELQHVQQTDISASDIRRRLLSASETALPNQEQAQMNIDTIQRDDKIDANKPRTEEDYNLYRVPTEVAVEGAEVVGGGGGGAGAVRFTDVTSDVQPNASDAAECIDNDNTQATQTERAPPTSLLTLVADRETTHHSTMYIHTNEPEWGGAGGRVEVLCVVVESVAVELSAALDCRPLLAAHLDCLAVRAVLASNARGIETTVTVSEMQLDNLQFESGLYDFAVVATTPMRPRVVERWPPMWSMLAEHTAFNTHSQHTSAMLRTRHDMWTVHNHNYSELTEVEVSLGPLALYVEDAFVTSLVEVLHVALPPPAPADDAAALQRPLRLKLLHIHSLGLTLTLHTAVRMYIALDQSPLLLSELVLSDVMTSWQQLSHALTVHYLSATILGAGWMVGGLELLGAPGALAARVGGARGGVRGVATATAAALLRSLSAWASSVARNLDLLAGDMEHAARAARARRAPRRSLAAGLAAGLTNLAVNMLGAVGGLAHHPLVGVAVGEAPGGAAALRRGLLGAITKPLSATADLVAYAGHGLLHQTGWDTLPQSRGGTSWQVDGKLRTWRQHCVRWCFKLCELNVIAGFLVLIDNKPTVLLVTHRFLMLAEPQSEHITEMIECRQCALGQFDGSIIELHVRPRELAGILNMRLVDNEEYQTRLVAMERVARYTGADTDAGRAAPGSHVRVLTVRAAMHQAHALYAVLIAVIYHNSSETHFSSLL